MKLVPVVIVLPEDAAASLAARAAAQPERPDIAKIAAHHGWDPTWLATGLIVNALVGALDAGDVSLVRISSSPEGIEL